MNAACCWRRLALMSKFWSRRSNSTVQRFEDPVNFAKVERRTINWPSTNGPQVSRTGRRMLSTSTTCHNAADNEGGGDSRRQAVARVMYIHNPIQAFANWLRLLSLRYSWDPQFNSNEFVNGARQAVILVSSLVAKGDFTTLSDDGLLSKKAVEGVRNETSQLNHESKSMLRLSTDDIHVSLVQRVNLQTIVDLRYADIDVLFVGAKFKEVVGKEEQSSFRNDRTFAGAVLIYISTRFHREYTEGSIPSWTITSLSYRFN